MAYRKSAFSGRSLENVLVRVMLWGSKFSHLDQWESCLPLACLLESYHWFDDIHSDSHSARALIFFGRKFWKGANRRSLLIQRTARSKTFVFLSYWEGAKCRWGDEDFLYFLASLPGLPRRFNTRSRPFVRIPAAPLATALSDCYILT